MNMSTLGILICYIGFTLMMILLKYFLTYSRINFNILIALPLLLFGAIGIVVGSQMYLDYSENKDRQVIQNYHQKINNLNFQLELNNKIIDLDIDQMKKLTNDNAKYKKVQTDLYNKQQKQKQQQMQQQIENKIDQYQQKIDEHK